MKVLVDTCVLSEIRHPKGDPAVKQAVAAFQDEALLLSVLTLGEITRGIALLPAISKKRHKKRQLSDWLIGLDQLFADRILPIDRETAQMWGELTARARTKGVSVPVADGLIAATALRHGLHVMTRNTEQFAASGAVILDPWPGKLTRVKIVCVQLARPEIRIPDQLVRSRRII